jgi:predicted anti-sigma-YlaC factor YlaD
MRFWRRDRDELACREFVELVSDYLDESMAASDRARFEAHLAECDGCTSYLQDIRLVVGALHQVPPTPDPVIHETLLNAFRDLRRSD